MKTLLLSLTCAALTASVHAQIFQPETARNILIGSVAGAIIGENNHHQALEGAAIGAAAGYVWSAATQPSRAYEPPVPVVTSPAPSCEERVVYSEPVRTTTVYVTRPAVVVRPRVVVTVPPPPPAPVIVVHERPRHVRHSRVVYVTPADGCGHRDYYYGRPVHRW